MNPDRLDAGLEALVRLHTHLASLLGGKQRIFENAERGEAALDLVEAWHTGRVRVVLLPESAALASLETQGPAKPSASINHYDPVAPPAAPTEAPPPLHVQADGSPFPTEAEMRNVIPRELDSESLLNQE
jgi:hypothetical protein